MRKIIYFTFILLFLSCKNDNSKLSEEILSKTFYDFDKVEYYKINLSISEIDKICSPPLPSKSIKDSIENSKKGEWNSFLKLYSPEKTDDVRFLKMFNEIKKTKILIESKYYDVLKSKILIEKKCDFDQDMIPSVAPLYTDVFIFSKNNKIIGIAKLNSMGNFSHVFVGANMRTTCFGQNGEMNYLKKILNTKSFLK
jgi:hypothetical protein